MFTTEQKAEVAATPRSTISLFVSGEAVAAPKQATSTPSRIFVRKGGSERMYAEQERLLFDLYGTIGDWHASCRTPSSYGMEKVRIRVTIDLNPCDREQMSGLTLQSIPASQALRIGFGVIEDFRSAIAYGGICDFDLYPSSLDPQRSGMTARGFNNWQALSHYLFCCL